MSSRAQIVDEYGEINRQFNLWKPPAKAINPHEARKKELEQVILNWPLEQEAAPSKELVFRGEDYQVKVSACGFKQVVSLQSLSEAFESIRTSVKEKVFEFFTPTLDALKDKMGKAWYDSHVSKAQTGPRKITVAAKEAASTEAAA